MAALIHQAKRDEAAEASVAAPSAWRAMAAAAAAMGCRLLPTAASAT